MLNFCTLFDSNYLSRGLALYQSLANVCRDFHLYIFPFDDKCLEVLRKLNLQNVTLISLQEFEDKALLKVKNTRSHAEYCWTCTPSVILYVLNHYSVNICTYLDADLYFFASPEKLLDELQDSSVIITEHRFAPEFDKSQSSGKYNVQFMTFRNNEYGLKTLNWWRESCIESCELDAEKGKCGDQKYLDDWPTRFQGIHELQNLGGGVAPWNVSQYCFYQKNRKIYGKVLASRQNFELIFFHFHALKVYKDGYLQLTNLNYKITRDVFDLIYRPYLMNLIENKAIIKKIDNTFDPNGALDYYKKNKDQSIDNLFLLKKMLMLLRITKKRLIDRDYNSICLVKAFFNENNIL